MPVLSVIVLMAVVGFFFWYQKPNPGQYTTKDLVAILSFFATGVSLVFGKLVPAIFFMAVGALFWKLK
ncbi:MAG: hypothetical protein UT61_C0012G0017 [Candidatus Woesebacteria bacterium GW2011_GWA1_39_8]|jgi:hypothetical protein|uniref:Uncharacterized protein n=1 Tax=Candidatus Woesebacteria bacterium GW2011_GWA1_39_8 TaxID=1618552 RepID=A0A0G0SX44_9BACT|nr:MAG: hypothetical protein UT61_C0012G0017 [Candidatus Woesebacteria bacterium GW2011_GWA1_39_8]